MRSEYTRIFKAGSRTYFNSSFFFPRNVRDDVITLYAFVRTADDFVDQTPRDREGFHRFKKIHDKNGKGRNLETSIVRDFKRLASRKGFLAAWPRLFLNAMESDLGQQCCRTMSETQRYMVGSAEVIGLMMSAILGLPKKAWGAARLLGRAMQYINFIRDIDEDLGLGRTYLPVSEQRKAGLDSLDLREAEKKPDAFKSFIRSQIGIYSHWQSEAEKGFRYIPRKFLVPIKTASDMYKWTARIIENDPFIVFQKKVKPPKILILLKMLMNMAAL